jgi:hypothetical protein
LSSTGQVNCHQTQGARFIEAEELDADDAEAVQAQVRRRILRAFVRRGLLEKEDRKEMEQTRPFARRSPPWRQPR